MRGGAYENVSEAYRAEVSPERRVLQVYTLYCITLHQPLRCVPACQFFRNQRLPRSRMKELTSDVALYVAKAYLQ